jgi:hypothetical protein
MSGLKKKKFKKGGKERDRDKDRRWGEGENKFSLFYSAGLCNILIKFLCLEQ